MRIKAKLYPYPLLESCFGQEDYIDSKFNILVDYSNKESNVQLTFTAVLDNVELKKLIQEGKATYAVHVECPLTSYRKLFRIKDSFILNLDANEIEGLLQICTFIIAEKDLINYSNKNFNEDYLGISFNIEKGNVLAIGDSFDIDIHKSKDEIGNMESIFGLIELADENEEDIKIDLTMDKINIALPKRVFSEFKALMRTRVNQPVLHSMILIPALMEAIDKMKESIINGDFYSIQEKRWYRSIVKAGENVGIIIDSDNIPSLPSFETAQKIIRQNY